MGWTVISAKEPANAPAIKELKRIELVEGAVEVVKEEEEEEEEKEEEEEEEAVDVWFRRLARST
jgi:hypothetical protein